MRTSDPPDDLPDRVLRLLREADGAVPAGTLQRRLARDGIDVAKRVVVETADDLAEAGRAEREPGPKYCVRDG
ncbi:MAG: hypothetical protein ABEJ34_01495 [Haloferacaceae archaeon]